MENAKSTLYKTENENDKIHCFAHLFYFIEVRFSRFRNVRVSVTMTVVTPAFFLKLEREREREREERERERNSPD